MAEWLSIEVFDGSFSASSWRNAHGESLIEAGLTNGAQDWVWHEHRWGQVLELLFDSEERADAFRELPAVRAALDAVPDPVNGLLVYKGRGGGSGSRVPRRPRPHLGAGAAEPEIEPEPPLKTGLGIAQPPSPVHG